MKKSVFLAVFLIVTLNASAQWFDFSNNNNRLGAGFQIGLAGWRSAYSDIGTGFSLNVMGVYVDYLQGGPLHKYDNHVTDKLYNDSVAFHINVGYQIPVLSWLRVMPLVGYLQTNAGITDASTMNFETDEGYRRSSMYHDYDVTPGTRKHYFNAGLGLFVQPIRWAELYAIGSLHGIYGGISFNVTAFLDRK